MPIPNVDPVNPNNRFPPVGTDRPPLGAGMVGSGTRSMKIDNVRTYECKADDTSFDVVSRRLFDTEKYGQALFRFNKEMGVVKQNSPRLTSGQSIQVPTTDLLERKYPTAIGNNPVPAPVGLGSRSTDELSRVPPVPAPPSNDTSPIPPVPQPRFPQPPSATPMPAPSDSRACRRHGTGRAERASPGFRR